MQQSSVFDRRKPRLLDLFCGAGGAGTGYALAGFKVVGVDRRFQPRYPFQFTQGDAIKILKACIPQIRNWDVPAFDAIHASPPCQHYSDLAKRNGNAHEHPDLIAEVRELLEETGLPYVIENVEGAPLYNAQTICGTSCALFVDGYRLRRHRLFETNWPLRTPTCNCSQFQHMPVMDVSGGGPTDAPRRGPGGRTFKGSARQVRALMGMPWATKAECNEAIPPAYTELIGTQLLPLVHRRQLAPSVL